MVRILKYAECAGGHHIFVEADIDGKPASFTFDKNEVFPEPLEVRGEVLAAIRDKISVTHPLAISVGDVDWATVKSEIEKP